MKKSITLVIALVLVAALGLSACGGTASSAVSSAPAPSSSVAVSSETHDPVALKVAAAASLETAYVNEIIPAFQAEYPWVTVTGVYDSSGKLQTQIEEGLDADVFMSAATKQMTALVDGSYIAQDEVVDLLENRIVLIAPADSDTTIDSFEKITEAGTIALGDPESVPVGQYSKEALTSLGIWDAALAKASLGTNVTEVLNWVAEGSADVGIVYATDAATTDKVKVIAEAPEGSLATKVIYPIAPLSASANKEAADLFVAFLQTPEMLEVFKSYGFVPNV
ncbi:MAG: molybdate ABC transporter substrate-binding protein [Oscillospiraceae bacterium]